MTKNMYSGSRYFLYTHSLYTQPLSHPVSAITGSIRSAQTELHTPMSGMPVLPTAKLPPFKIGNNMETFYGIYTELTMYILEYLS